MIRSRIGTAAVFLAVLSCLPALGAQSATKIIDNGPDADKLILAVLGDGYAAADQTQFNQDVNRLVMRGIFGHDFFEENQNAFNVYRVNLISAVSGVTRRVYDENGTPADPRDDRVVSTIRKDTPLRFIYSGSWAHCWLEPSSGTRSRINRALSRYAPGADFAIILLNEDGPGGCGGGGRAVVTRSESWPVVAHEMGHGFGGLRDEYAKVGRGCFKHRIEGPNVSTRLDRGRVYWKRFIAPTTALPTLRLPGMDPNRTVGMFEGGNTYEKCVYRPVYNCRMNGNSPLFCPVCYTVMKTILREPLAHDFSRALAGDFDGDGRTDILVHNGDDLAIFRTRAPTHELDHYWTANNEVPAASGSVPWPSRARDRHWVADVNGDGRDDVVVFNPGDDWPTPRLGILRARIGGLECVARYDGVVPGYWTLKRNDTFAIADFDGDRRSDLYVFNGTDWSDRWLGLLRSTGSGLTLTTKHRNDLSGWQMQKNDAYRVADFDGDGKDDLFAINTFDWSTGYLGMMRSTGADVTRVRLYTTNLPGRPLARGDRFHVGDFNGDGMDDLFVFNGADWDRPYLNLLRSGGNHLARVATYNPISNGVPGWVLRGGDQFVVGDADRDGRADLYVFNTRDWSTEYLGALRSNGVGLTCTNYAADRVGSWNLAGADTILAANFEGASRGTPDLFIRNPTWFGLIRWQGVTGPFVLDRLYHHWIYSPLYDAEPWSDGLY